MASLALGLLLRLLVRRGIAEFVRRRLERRVALIDSLIRQHERDEHSSLDRLLFQLGRSHDPRAVETALRGRIENPDPERHPELKRIYDSLGLTARYMRQLREAPKWSERAAAATALSQLGALEAIPVLVEAIRDPHEDPRTVKLAAARALGQMRATEAIPIFVEHLREVDELASPRLAELLCEFGEDALPALHEAIEDEERLNARIWASQILGRIGHPSSVPYLLARLTDRAERVRISAAEALGRLGDRQAVHELVRVRYAGPVAAGARGGRPGRWASWATRR